MKFKVRDIPRAVLDWALETVKWLFMTLREKEDVARYFLTNYDTPRDAIGDKHLVPSLPRGSKTASKPNSAA